MGILRLGSFLGALLCVQQKKTLPSAVWWVGGDFATAASSGAHSDLLCSTLHFFCSNLLSERDICKEK